MGCIWYYYSENRKKVFEAQQKYWNQHSLAKQINNIGFIWN